MKKKVGGIISIVILIPVLLFVAGIVAQFIININAWKAAGSDYRTSPGLPSLELDAIISALFTFPEGPIAIAVIVIGIALICVFGLRLGWNRGGMTDLDRNLTISSSGSYGTAGHPGPDEFREGHHTAGEDPAQQQSRHMRRLRYWQVEKHFPEPDPSSGQARGVHYRH